jgi:cytochrome c2
MITKYILILTFIASYLFGIASYKEKYFPIPQISHALKNEIFNLKSLKFENKNSSNFYSIKNIETSLIPLKINFYSINSLLINSSYKKGGGGLSKFGDEILIIDENASLYKFNEKINITKIDIPEIPFQKVYSPRGTSVAYNEKSGRVYIAYFEIINENNCIFHIQSADLAIGENQIKSSWKREYRSEIINHNGAPTSGAGKILLQDTIMYFSIGSFSSTNIRDESMKPQDSNSSIGKISKLNLMTGNSSIFTSGHRNPQGITSSTDGTLYSVEHGPQGGDELNILLQGGNYGWPLKTYGTDYGSYSWDNDNKFDTVKLISKKFNEPIYSWIPSIAPSSIIQLSKFYKTWDKDFLIGTLKTQSIFRLKINDGRIIYSEPIWIGKRIRDLYQKNATIYILTDDGMLGTVNIDFESLEKNIKSEGLILSGKLSKCLVCHHVGNTTPSNTAPSFSGIINKNIASDSFLKYSEGLKNRTDEKWTIENLRIYLASPQEFAPGTSMPNLKLKPNEINEIIEALNNISQLY